MPAREGNPSVSIVSDTFLCGKNGFKVLFLRLEYPVTEGREIKDGVGSAVPLLRTSSRAFGENTYSSPFYEYLCARASSSKLLRLPSCSLF